MAISRATGAGGILPSTRPQPRAADRLRWGGLTAPNRRHPVMTTPETNPYEAPQSAAPKVAPRPVPWRLYIGWTFALAANLVVPLGLGWEMAARVGRVGIGIAVVMLWVLGLVACGPQRKAMRIIAAGSILTALSQFVPVLQFLAGIFGLGVASLMERLAGVKPVVGEPHSSTPAVTSEFAGFVATMVTAGLVLVAAFVSGLILRVMTPTQWWDTPPDAERPTAIPPEPAP